MPNCVVTRLKRTYVTPKATSSSTVGTYQVADLPHSSRRGRVYHHALLRRTCVPDDFAAESFTLRPAIYGRHTELFIAITMYNEDEVLFCRTFHGVMKNIAHLCSRNKSRTWVRTGGKRWS